MLYRVRTILIKIEKTINVLHISGCADPYSKCDESVKNGDCDAKPFLMSGLCPASCELCDTSCKNSYSSCDMGTEFDSCENMQPDSTGCNPGEYFSFLLNIPQNEKYIVLKAQ